MGDIGILAGRVDDDHQPVLDPADHQIVQNTACLVREHAVAHLADGEALTPAGYWTGMS